MRYRELYSLHRRKTVKGISVWYYQTYDDQNRRTTARSTGQTVKTLARRYCQRLYSEGKLIPKSVPTLNEFTKDWYIYDKCPYIKGILIRGGSYSRKNADIQRAYLKNYILPSFGSCRLDKITPAMIEEWLFSLTDTKLANVTINHMLRCFKTILQEAERLEILTRSPVRQVKPLKNDSRVKGILTKTEAKKVLGNAELWDNDLMYLANRLAACTGMRLGEIQGLQSKNLYKHHVHVCHSLEKGYGLKSTKTGRVRDIPIPDHLSVKLQELKKRNPSGFLFSQDGGINPVTNKTFSKYLYRALERTGITDKKRRERNITFHSWRHYFNSTLRASGIADSKVQSVTGHSTQAMTEHYTHFNLQDYKEIRKVQESIG